VRHNQRSATIDVRAIATLILASVVIGLPVSAGELDLVGSYAPIGIDAGIVLSLSANGSFTAQWWGQDMKSKSGKFVGGKVDGSWKWEDSKVVLRFDTKDRKGCVCEFRREQKQGKRELILVHPSEFPLSDVFGDDYLWQESKPNQLPDPTSPSVTRPAGAGHAPSVGADH
jgi:hypothetical protein